MFQPLTHYFILIMFISSYPLNLIWYQFIMRALNCYVTFFSHCCIFQDLNMKKTMKVGKCCNGLNYLHYHTNFYAIEMLTFNIWHWFVGHHSINWSKVISYIDYKISFSSKILCFVCPIGKHVKFSFPFNNYKTISPFELVHCDIWGSFVILNNFGACYFLIIVYYFYSLNLSVFLLNIINLKVCHS